jgi:hypothetical protein
MGRKLDALLGRNLKTSKFKALAKLAISRTAILKNQRQVRCSHARSDVIELLNLGHQERALLRVISLSLSLSLSLSYVCLLSLEWISKQVEHVIKDQNMLDVFAMIDSYCNLLIERVALLQKNKLVFLSSLKFQFSTVFISYRLFQKLKMLENDEFNHLTIILI